ncbi:MAG: hypothetical protein UY05_C0052G0002 [Candidatus Peregrinibacteria bacterium GW2011_GWA2_47_7]|nr:MAG: hypothetical protein UY05_C0052G0002 [Candidatus Peregrinibacteria bacterium GW2011_GWA2_47_7]
MHFALKLFQLIVSILLVVTILLQDKGVGLSATFGGGGEFYKSKRGVDKFLFYATGVLAALFIANAVAFIFVK